MKKVIFALVLLAFGVLFIIQYLAGVADIETSKVADNALAKLKATGNKPEPIQNKPKASEQASNIVEKLADTVSQQVTETMTPSNTGASKTEKKKPRIAVIKIYDKKTAKETIIETPALLEAEQKKLSADERQRLQEKAARFRAYYQKPEKCLSPATKEIRVQCANEYMRAKAKFEQLYQQGKL